MAATGVSLTLSLTEGKSRGREVHVPAGEPYLIGRDDHCKLRLRAGKVSRVHCVISHGAEGFFIRDCVSRNGTFLNGKRLGTIPASMHSGDTLRIGPFVFDVEVSTEPRGSPSAADGGTIHWLG